MNKPSFLTESFGRSFLSVVLALILLPIITVSRAALSQENKGTEKQEAIRRVVQIFIETGQKEYEEGYYEEAVKTFLMAQWYEKDLTVPVREQLNELLKKSQMAVLQRKSVSETFRTVNELIEQDQLILAKTYLEKIKDSEFLTTEERKQISEVFRRIDAQIIADKAELEKVKASTKKTDSVVAGVKKPVVDPNEQKKEATALFYSSVGFYSTGQFEKAREGFVKVASSGVIPLEMKKTAESYLTFYSSVDFYSTGQFEKSREGFVKVSSSNLVPPSIKKAAEVYLTQINQMTEEVVTPKAAPKVEPEVASEVVAPEAAPRVASPVTGQSSYIEVTNRKRNIIRSHTRAVVNDAIAKARNYINQARFDKAKNEVETATLTVNQNQMHLGEELFKEYSSKLKELTEEIAEKENEKIRQQAEEKREAAKEAQRQFGEQMGIDREKQIAELMENALTYQKQQRYEAALGQLVSLLALDPQNEQALVLKDTLEDMIYFRKQLDLQKESRKQRADVLMKTEESGIPYAEELTYPKYWRELIEKPTRQPDKPIGLDEADARVYEQLEKPVDLPDLTPGMSFGEVVEKLKNSVQPPIQIQPNWRDLLENAEVEPSTPAGMDPLTGVKLRKALEILIAGVSSVQLAQLTYVVDEGVIQIGTIDMLPPKMVHRVYDISDLVAEPANFRGMGGGMGMMGMGMGGMGMGGMGGMMGGMGGYGGGMGGYGGGMGGMGGMGGYGGGMMGGMGGMGGYGGGMMGGMGGGMGGYGGGMGGYGGGMGGYGGGMGGMGGGMGGYGGGMGGYGGGMGGYGGGMMGGMGGMMGGMGGMAGYISEDLRYLIQETIEPDSWFETSDTGEGTITAYPTQQPRKLAVMQTVEVHQEIEKLLDALRKALGNQVAIEAVFLVVSENFLEDVGLDVDFSTNLGGKWGQLSFEQGSSVATTPDASTKVQGSLGGLSVEGSLATPAVISGGYGTILDDLQVSFLLRAVQAHTDSKSVTAPKGTVMSGESASFSVQDLISYALPPTTTTVTQATGVGTAGTTAGTQQNIGYISVGSSLSITPTISNDKKHVLLYIMTQLTDLLRLRTHQIQGPVGTTGEVQEYSATVPETETSSVMTRVSVPDGGTLLLGGQKITAEVEKEAGVPILSKIPILGRLFSNRSEIRDHKILLILVKPSIILLEERDAEAIAAMEGEL